MKIMRPNKPVFADISGVDVCYKPRCRYVVSDYESICLVKETPTTSWVVSSAVPYERRVCGQNLNGKNVLFYRHTAFGDMLMITSVPRYLKTIYPNATIQVYCDPSMLNMWDGNIFVGGYATPLPIPFDSLAGFDYHIMYEGMLENNSEPDQKCCYDDFFSVIGFHNVPDEFKKPYIVPLPSDYTFVASTAMSLHGKFMVYHLSPANKNRCYPPAKSVEFITKFLNEHSNWRVFVVGKSGGSDDWVYSGFKNMTPKDGRIIDLVDKVPSFRGLLPFVEAASLVVCPDSSVMHLSACFPSVPVISLWGVFSPDDRVKYYTNNIPIFKKDTCPFAPCRVHTFHLPDYCRGDGFCNVLSSITAEDILDTARRLI